MRAEKTNGSAHFDQSAAANDRILAHLQQQALSGLERFSRRLVRLLKNAKGTEWKNPKWLFQLLADDRIKIDESNFQTDSNFQKLISIVGKVQTATHFNSGTEAKLHFRNSSNFKNLESKYPFLAISGLTGFLILTPVTYWSYLDGKYSSGKTKEIGVDIFCYEEKTFEPRESDEIISETWDHSTKSGERDYRYKDNSVLYEVFRYGVTLLLQDESEWRLSGLSEDEQDRLHRVFLELTWQDGKYSTKEEAELFEKDEPDVESWFDVLGVSPNATQEQIKVAYHEKIKQYHPDRVSGLGEKLRALAETETKKLNAAREKGLDAVR